jgi:rieske iron-sulfur protein
MNTNEEINTACQQCQLNNGNVDQGKRQTIKWVSMSGLTTLPFMNTGALAENAPVFLVDADAEKDFKPLRPADLAIGKPMLVYPFDSKSGTPKNESRLNKLVVIRLPEDQMTAETRARSASGVLAYSGICTHQGCEVKTWMSKENVLACYCHSSKFALLDSAKVVGGPAPKPLPSISLAMEGEFLSVVASSPANQG